MVFNATFNNISAISLRSPPIKMSATIYILFGKVDWLKKGHMTFYKMQYCTDSTNHSNIHAVYKKFQKFQKKIKIFIKFQNFQKFKRDFKIFKKFQNDKSFKKFRPQSIYIYRSINPCIDLNGRLYLYNIYNMEIFK